ncbi:hypothetical protein BAE44_0021809 [Dichanthelium oligosanthes]|uniref:Uncharacterized protein n=1 Tax=Dichanthelium oligosanthes TaxID=888268 RepID=A0A1E5UWB6_9POAL|nr:hypothetical protein BAE44_0021809 [Dichanthelium oligosanthes]
MRAAPPPSTRAASPAPALPARRAPAPLLAGRRRPPFPWDCTAAPLPAKHRSAKRQLADGHGSATPAQSQPDDAAVDREEMERKAAFERLDNLGRCITDVESSGEKVFRALINTRVSLLNIPSQPSEFFPEQVHTIGTQRIGLHLREIGWDPYIEMWPCEI